MDWEFEWPAQMLMFDTTIEPFGKEHYIGSWPFAKRVILEVYEGKLPIVFFYEYFLINKKKMATRHGNVIPISTLSKYLEPEVIRFIYTKRPEKQRNLELSKIYHYVNDFDLAERVYFEIKKARNEKEEIKLKKSYELAMLGNIPKKFPNRLSFLTLLKIVQQIPESKWKKVIKKRVKEEYAVKYNMKRIYLIKNYVNDFLYKEILKREHEEVQIRKS